MSSNKLQTYHYWVLVSPPLNEAGILVATVHSQQAQGLCMIGS